MRRAGPAATRGLALLLAVCAAAPGLAVTVAGPLGRWSAGGYAEGYGVFRVDRDTRQQRPAGIVDLALTGDLHRRLRFHLDMRTTFGGTPEHAHGGGFINPSDTFQNVSPFVEVEEGYFDLFLPSLDVRVGKLDTFQPTDVLNPRRFTDPFVMEEQDAKIGVPALRAAYYLPPLAPRLGTDVGLTLIWVPVPVPIRFPLQDERWFPSTISLTQPLDVPKQLVPKGFPALVVENHFTTRNVRPPQQLDEGSVGLRLAGLSGRTDWSLYYYDGNETAPSFALQTTVRATHRSLACLVAMRSECPLRGDVALTPTFGRIRLVGGDAAADIGGFTARVEAAFGTDRLLPRPAEDLVSPENLLEKLGPHSDMIRKRLLAGKAIRPNLGDLFVARDTVEWGAGVDYHWHGWMPVVQVNQTVVLDNQTRLLVSDVDTRLFLVLRRNFLAERLNGEMGVLQGLERSSTSGLLRLTYTITDSLRVRIGYLFIAGTRNSLVGEFHHNDEGFVQVRYSY